ncbi:translocation/assembly module TamB domain-containing protein [Anthocerotibacter panamensis]|uniref:translocation/assembly module TamB domain-containing protein n=1 Tax=Anthocerotibacter panamensis TaxID=2857077 RepID=UPI001C405E46|nr:translocation/assembly module TamB domain-containing protein [Anthocerotibacter panamensis]
MNARWWWLLGGICAVLVIAWVGVVWLSPTLVRQAEEQLSTTFQSRVRLGKIQSLSLWSVGVGPVVMASTPDTLPPLLIAPRADLNFNLLGLLTSAHPQLTLERPALYLERNSNNQWNLPRLPAQPARIESPLSQVNVHGGSLTYRDRVLGGNPLSLTDLEVQANLAGDRARYFSDARLETGNVHLEGQTQLANLATTAQVQLKNLPVDRLAMLAKLGDLTVRQGALTGTLALGWRDGRFTAVGPLRLTDGALAIASLPDTLKNLDVTGQLAWPRLALKYIQANYLEAQIQGTGQSLLPERLQLDLSAQNVQLTRFSRAFGLAVPLAGQLASRFTALLPLASPQQVRVQGTAKGGGPLQVDRLVADTFSSRFTYEGEQLVAPFSLTVGGGNVSGTARAQLVRGFQFAVAATGRGLQPQVLAARYQMRLPVIQPGEKIGFIADIEGGAGRVTTASIQQAVGTVGGQPFQAMGHLALLPGALAIRDTRVRFVEDGGTSTLVGRVGLQGQQPLALTVNLEGVPLRLVNRSLGGRAVGQVQVTGPLAQLDSLRVAGTLVVAQPRFQQRNLPRLDTRFSLQNQTLALQKLTLGGLAATGTVALDLADGLVRKADLQWSATDLNLADLPLPLETTGWVKGRGILRGTLQDPEVQGQLVLRQGRIGRYTLEQIQGPIRLQGRILTARLTGDKDELAARVVFQEQGAALSQLIARVNTTQVHASDGFYDYKTGLARLTATVTDLDLVQVGAIGPLRSLAGRVDGRVQVARSARGLEGSGKVQIREAKVNRRPVSLEPLQFRFDPAQVVLAPTTLTTQTGQYRLAGQVGWQQTAPLDLMVEVQSGRLEEVVDLLGLGSVRTLLPNRVAATQPRGRARDLGVQRIEAGMAPLPEQLVAYDRATQSIASRKTERKPALPDDLRQLQGQFSLSARVTGTRQSPRLQFDLKGADWRWQQFQIEALQARGNYQDGQLALEESEARYGARRGQLTGMLARAGQSQARLVVTDFPVQLVSPLLPVGARRLQGDFSTTVDLAGNLSAPQANAEVHLTALEFDGKRIDPVKARLVLEAGRVTLLEARIGSNERAVGVVGSLPVPLLNPDNPRLDLQVNLAGQDLPLLNLVTDQLVWQPATGKATLTVQGTFDEPLLFGLVELGNTSVRLTQSDIDLQLDQLVTRFDQRQLQVERFEGRLAGASLTAQGELPLQRPDLLTTQPLAVRIKGPITLPSLYQGTVDGQLNVRGALLQPVLGGQLTLNPGRLLLGLSDFQALSSPRTATKLIDDTPVLSVSFDDLRLGLGPEFDVGVGTLNTRVAGILALTGPLSQLRAKGTLSLPEGSLQIGSTRFRLDTSHANHLVFTGKLDPQLDLAAEARISDFTFTNTFASAPSAGRLRALSGAVTTVVDQVPLGRYDRLLVQAAITGTAADPTIALTSAPPRTQEEILGLITGGVLNFEATQASGLLTGLVAAGGNALFAPFQRNLAAQIGLDELNIGLSSQVAAASPQNFSLGIGAEAIKDLTANFSLGVARNLTEGAAPTLFSVRFRVTEPLVLRLSTTEDLNDLSFTFSYVTQF